MSRSWNDLIRSLIERRILQSHRVIRALKMVPREVYLPDDETYYASVDTPLPIGDGQTISAPLD